MTKLNLPTSLIAGTLLLLSAAGPVLAQDASSTNSANPALASTAEKKPPAKSHKVWTEDNVTTLRTPADNFEAQKHVTAPAPPSGSGSSTNGKKHNALSDPQSVEEADKMMAWEQRDLQAQTEYLDRVNQQIQQADGDERTRLEQEVAYYTKVLARTKAELKNLQDKKSEFEKARRTQSSQQAATASSERP